MDQLDTDLEDIKDNRVYEVIGHIVTDFALLEATLGDWVAKLVGLNQALTAVLLGRMDARGRTDKIRELLKLHGRESELRVLKAATKSITSIQETRNIVAHGLLLGITKQSRQYVFAIPMKAELLDKEIIVPTYGYTIEHWPAPGLVDTRLS